MRIRGAAGNMSYFPSGHQGQGNRPQHHQAFQAKKKAKKDKKLQRQ